MGLLLFALALRGNIKFFKTAADNIIYRGRTDFVAAESFHQVGSFQITQRIAGSLSLCFGVGVTMNDRQGFQHPFKINSRGIFALSMYRKLFIFLFKE